ncbi:MAG: hypothetical protein K1X53_08265 [Candidatus Sumerlaeaceae bacterium]|nr:hypothetical protein [Candidatus Sumerlaeaceae bacterium]
MMIPRLVKKVSVAAVIIAAVLGAQWMLRDVRAGAYFLAASVWSVANLLVLAAIVTNGLRPGAGDKMGLLSWAVLKMVLFFGGIVAIFVFRPTTPGEVGGLFAGISLTLLIAVLTIAGAAILGIDIVTGKKISGAAVPGGANAPTAQAAGNKA